MLVCAILVSSCATEQTKRLSKDEAAARITDYVNEQLQNRTYTPKMYSPEDNVPRPYPRIVPRNWSVSFVAGRWVGIRYAGEIYITPDVGLFIRASVDEFGKDPRMEDCKWLSP